MNDTAILDAVKNNDVGALKALCANPLQLYCFVLTKSGRTLLQEAISYNSKEAFDWLLSFHDPAALKVVNCYGDTALTHAMCQGHHYYIYALVHKGAPMDARSPNGDALLHLAINQSAQLTHFFLTRDSYVNTISQSGYTPLQYVVHRGVRNNVHELVPMLLYHGADPHFRGSITYNAFELSVIKLHSDSIQEILFDYTFDKTGSNEIHIEALLILAHRRSPLFSRLFQYDIECLVNHQDPDCFSRHFDQLFLIDTDYLSVLLKRCHVPICQIVEFGHVGEKFLGVATRYDLLSSSQIILKLSLLIDSCMNIKLQMTDFICNLHQYFFPFRVVSDNRDNEGAATDILMFMISYGLRWEESLYDLVYTMYGYCDLFKFLLHLECHKGDFMSHLGPKNLMAALIYDVRLHWDEFLERPAEWGQGNVAEELLNRFGGANLAKALASGATKWYLSEQTEARIRRRQEEPQVPKLVEMARNVCRKYLVERFGVTRTKDLYGLIGRLPINSVYKKILTFETKLYCDK